MNGIFLSRALHTVWLKVASLSGFFDMSPQHLVLELVQIRETPSTHKKETLSTHRKYSKHLKSFTWISWHQLKVLTLYNTTIFALITFSSYILLSHQCSSIDCHFNHPNGNQIPYNKTDVSVCEPPSQMTFLIICLLFTLTSKELWAYSGTNKEQLNLREALKNATAHLSTSVEVKIQSKERNTSHLNRKYPI